MKKLSFFHGVLLALALSFIGSAAYAVLAPLVSTYWMSRLAISIMVGLYAIYLLRATESRIGRVTAFAGLFLTTGAAVVMELPVAFYALSHTTYIWLVRACYFHKSVLSAVVDLIMSAFALIVAVWALQETNSLFMAFWSFFLVQAAIVPFIKSRFTLVFSNAGGPRQSEEPFERAHRTAEAALRKLVASNQN